MPKLAILMRVTCEAQLKLSGGRMPELPVSIRDGSRVLLPFRLSHCHIYNHLIPGWASKQ